MEANTLLAVDEEQKPQARFDVKELTTNQRKEGENLNSYVEIGHDVIVFHLYVLGQVTTENYRKTNGSEQTS